MAEMPDVVTLTTISSDWGNDIRDRTVQRYSSVANRTTEHPSPSEGDLSYLEDSNTLDVYTGAAWVPFIATNEVDGSVEAFTSPTSLTTSFAVYATVNLAIPAGWGSWKCEAFASCFLGLNTSGFVGISIDGTDQQPLVVASGNCSVGGRRTGMTTTGSRAITLKASAATTPGQIQDIYLYARAVRTS